MARRVFFSFHYENDINRSMVVRESWVFKGIESVGFIDKAEFEKVKKNGVETVHKWIDEQLNGTSVTVVLIGECTLGRDFVQYEIMQSYKRGNGIIGVYIHDIKDMVTGLTSSKGNTHVVIGVDKNGNSVYFDSICDGIYDYKRDNGYDNLGDWIEKAARKHNK